MEIAIGVGISIIVGLIANRYKKKRHMRDASVVAPEDAKRRKADEELITVILPTIQSDK